MQLKIFSELKRDKVVDQRIKKTRLTNCIKLTYFFELLTKKVITELSEKGKLEKIFPKQQRSTISFLVFFSTLASMINIKGID